METVRGGSHGRSTAAASPSVSILSDLNSPGGIRTASARRRAVVIWLSGAGVVVSGIAAGILLLGQTPVGSTGAQVAANVVADQRARVGSERHMEADSPRVVKDAATAEPRRGSLSVLAATPGPTSSEGAALIHADQVALVPPMHEARSPGTKVVKKHEPHSSAGRASSNAVPSRKERSGVVASRSNSKKTEQKLVSKRLKDGERLAVVNKRSSSDVVRPKPEAPRPERDVDIITAIVK